jgi:hypothetical protein
MRQYDFQAFLNSISDLDYPKMIQEAGQEGMRVQRVLSPGRGIKGIDKQYKYKAQKYEELLRGFVFFLRYGTRPSGISDWDFQSFRPVIEKLVEKGQLKSTILSLFETTN